MFTTALVRNLINAFGYKTTKKIVVIESDDWGAIRMPSKKVYEDLIKKKYIDANDPFLKYDGMESGEDLQFLFETLSSVKDSENQSAKFTANVIVANPNFDLIKADDYQNYHYELVTETFKKYPAHHNSFKLWIEGKENDLFVPQLHGREHVNVYKWLTALQTKTPEFLAAFENDMYAVNASIAAALSYNNQQSKESLNLIIQEGSAIFKELFGHTSQSFIAPNYTWDYSVEKALEQEGIAFLQGSKKQNQPKLQGKLKTQYHYSGQKNKLGQTYLVRNCLFEPSVAHHIDYVAVCLKQIENAFFWKKPAIVCSHRLNYVGYLDEVNRDKNLKQLEILLKAIVKKWPEVVFMSTPDLIKEMKQ